VASDVHIQVKPAIPKHICASFLLVLLLVLHEDVVADGGAACCIELWVSAQQCEQPGLNDLGCVCSCVWQVLVINLRHATHTAWGEAQYIIVGLVYSEGVGKMPVEKICEADGEQQLLSKSHGG
jgi:hypothetical protein